MYFKMSSAICFSLDQSKMSSGNGLRHTVGRGENTCTWTFNSLPNNKILDWSISKAFADYNLDVLKIMILSLIE